MTPRATLLGLDIGGSKTRAVLTRGGVVVRELTVGGANLASVGVTGAQRALDAVAAALPDQDVDAVCAGAAGADSDEALVQLTALVQRRFSTEKVLVVHDTRIILAATGLDAGIVLISGTGSACWGRRSNGDEVRAGGWGYLLGDEGSGYGIARDAVQLALREVDTGFPASALSLALVAGCGLEHPWQLLRAFYQTADRAYWARHAGLVFALAEHGDADSGRIIDLAADALADLVLVVSERLGTAGPVVLAGGLAVNQQLLADGVRRRLVRNRAFDVRVLHDEPVHGALHLARRLLSAPTVPV